MKRLVVIGGGVAGMATALAASDRAKARGIELETRVLEAAPRPGGNLRSERVDGYTVEWGPNGFLDNVPATFDLVRRLGLEPELQPSDAAAAHRFLYRRGRLRELPGGALSFFLSTVLSIGGRLRVLREPWTRAKPAGLDETVHDFAARHIGEEAATALVGAMVSGVFAGDARALSLASAFPKMAAMEEGHGSLVRAMLARGRERKAAKRKLAELRARGEDAPELARPGGPAGPGGTLTSFRGGIETLVEGLARTLGGALETGRPAARLERAGERWGVHAEGGAPLAADAVVVAIPAAPARALLSTLTPPDGGLEGALAAIPAAGLAVVALAYDGKDVGGAANGFGFLAPRGEGLRVLGCLWDSAIFPGRAPAGKVLMRAMIGGALDPAAVGLPDEELVAEVRGDLRRAMGLEAAPERVWIFRHRDGISQYTVGHAARVAAIGAAETRHPGLYLAGQSYYGISMNSCIESAGTVADRVLAGLG
jgi:oxygen-dependent protoporphyrinogen oxidase